MCSPAIFLTLHLAAGIFLVGIVNFMYFNGVNNYNTLMGQIATVADRAATTSCDADLQGFPPTGLVFLSCDVTSTPDLSTAPEVRPIRALLSARNKDKRYVAYDLDASVWKWRWKSCGKNCNRCEEGWASFETETCDDDHPTPQSPRNLAPVFIMAAAAEIHIGSADAPFVLTAPLRTRLVNRLQPVGLELNSQSTSTPYSPPILAAENFATVQEDGAHGHLETGKGLGDVKVEVTGYAASQVSVFATVQKGLVGPDEPRLKDAATLTFGLQLQETEEYVVWPRTDASNAAQNHEQRMILSEWGNDRIAFVLDGAYTKDEAIERLRTETQSGMTWTLWGCLGLSVFSTIWGGCGLGFVTATGGGEGDPTAVCCGGLWVLVGGMSVANFFVALISLITGIRSLAPWIFVYVSIFLCGLCAVCALIMPRFGSAGTLFKLMARAGGSRDSESDSGSDDESPDVNNSEVSNMMGRS